MDALLPADIEEAVFLTTDFAEGSLITASQLAGLGLSSSNSLSSLFHLPKRNIGSAILIAAVEDYMGMDEQAHASAAQFLFPEEPAYREHYDWVVAMAAGVNRAWLRDALDRVRPRWDKERVACKLRAKLEPLVRRRISA